VLKQIAWIVAVMGGVSVPVSADAVGDVATTTSGGEIERAIHTMTAHIAADLSRDGPTAWIRYFDDNRGFLMAADGKLEFDGIAAARSFLSDFGKRIVHVEITWSDVRVDPLGSDLATVAAYYREALTDTQGHVARPHGYFTGVVVRRADGWKLRSLHWSSPGAEK
jgi:hypothetical protein